MSHQRIRFKNGTKGSEMFKADNDNLILVGGAITTPERFASFEDSLAHLSDDGRIMSYLMHVGMKDDLEEVADK